MKRLFLIDGHALIFRMYYAFLRRPMINSRGEDTSILFGFTKYILELLARESPTHLAIMFDPPAKTFRHELDPQYKGTRAQTPELIKEALEPLCRIAEALRIPVLMKPGFEADDIIGTVAKRFASPDFQVYMVTPDKDLGQIIDENIFQYKPGKSGAESEIISRRSICEHYGISDPLQIIDILSIWGDTADNVKGVSGIGEVGAKKLVAGYGSLENICAHLDELPAKQAAAFTEALPHLSLSKTLVTIKTDVDLEVSEDDLLVKEADCRATGIIFDRYEFNSLKNILPCGAKVQPVRKKGLECIRTDFSEVEAGIRKSGTVSLRRDSDVFIAASGVKWAAISPEKAETLIKDHSLVKVGHGFKGLIFEGKVLDTELLHYILNPERPHKIEVLSDTYLGADLSVGNEEPAEQMETSFDLFNQPSVENINSGHERAARECVAAGLLAPILVKEVEENGLTDLYFNIEMPLVSVLADMELSGVRIDCNLLSEYRNELDAELSIIEKEVRDMAGEPSLNLSSPHQIGIVLFDKLKLDPKAKKGHKDSYRTDEETLEAISDRHPIVGRILEYRAVKKLLSTYIEPFPQLVNPRTGKVHTTFNQALTATGRLSSARPNLQNIPIRTERGMRIREAFVPSDPDGYIVSADYSQIELRIMAHLSGDEGMIEGFRSGADVHRATAAKIFNIPASEVSPEQRRHAKVANFGIIYGISAFGLAQRMGIPRNEAKTFIEEYFRSYPGIRAYMDSAIEKASASGIVETIFARKRFLPDINSKNVTVRGLAQRNAINAPIQGSAADIIKLAMINVWRRMKKEGLRSRMVLQVHDELVFDVKADELEKIVELVKEEMESVCTLSVPLLAECGYGKNWREAH